MCIGIFFSSFSYAGSLKTLEPIAKQNIEFSFSQFSNYIKNGSPDLLEGIYVSPDNRYKVAIVKNDTKNHDYIGIVISADNEYWEVGDIKFNFVMKDDVLIGYYYNAAGQEIPVEFKIVKDNIETNCLKKIASS